jgi:hypothetical protein
LAEKSKDSPKRSLSKLQKQALLERLQNDLEDNKFENEDGRARAQIQYDRLKNDLDDLEKKEEIEKKSTEEARKKEEEKMDPYDWYIKNILKRG